MFSAVTVLCAVLTATAPSVSAAIGFGNASAQSAVVKMSAAPRALIHPPAIATGRDAESCGVDSCYYYSSMEQYNVVAAGASAAFSQAQPKLASSDYHSLTELSVASLGEEQVIEVGWIVAPELNGDSFTRLFVFHWINGVPTCYDTCGFVSVSKRYHPGQRVNVGHIGSYAIQFKKNQWQVDYNGELLGYFPAALWKGKFTHIEDFRVFGEVSSSSATTPHSQMGNGILGTKRTAAAVRDATLIGVKSPPPVFFYHPDGFFPQKYAVGNYSPNCKSDCGMTFGGRDFANDGGATTQPSRCSSERAEVWIRRFLEQTTGGTYLRRYWSF